MLVLTTLYFAGIDPSKHRIRSENERLKKAMVRSKQINDRKTLMPRIKKDVAKRFVRNSLWELKQNTSEKTENAEKTENSEDSLPT